MLRLDYLLIFEILGFLSFGIIIVREIRRRDYRQIFEIASCAVFGMLLEIGNTFLAGTYSYNPHFMINVANVPVAIGLGWAVIIYLAMRLSDQYGMPWTLRPFLDALSAVIIDLAIDPVAIRLGFWNWTIPSGKEWFGVPFENLAGWILVVLSFSFLIRFIRTLDRGKLATKLLMALSPFISYLWLIFGLAIFTSLAVLPYQIRHRNVFSQFSQSPDFAVLSEPSVVFFKTVIFAAILAALVLTAGWSLARYRHRRLERFDFLSFLLLVSLQSFFLIAAISAGDISERLIMVLVSIFCLLLNSLIQFLPFLLSRELIKS